MNIFEKYGSYEAVKQAALNYKNSGDMVTAAGLELQCLEYRRQHNIFEVGDRIVIDGKYDKTFMPVLTILDEGKNYYYCDDGQVHKHLMNQWRHATDEEIAAGKRL